ncbi:MAG: cyclase family protein [Pseudoruegeria sp.]
MPVLDLSYPLNTETDIYSEAGYSDPSLTIAPWCEIADQGYRVSQLSLGTQTGTHIDAPAHFDPEGQTLESLTPDALIGSYTLIDLRKGRCDIPQKADPILLLDARNGATMTQFDLNTLFALNSPVWVMAGYIEIQDTPSLEFHRQIAAAGIYLVEDLNMTSVDGSFPKTGEIIALPLRLEGTSGSPCRVLLRYI